MEPQDNHDVDIGIVRDGIIRQLFFRIGFVICINYFTWNFTDFKFPFSLRTAFRRRDFKKVNVNPFVSASFLMIYRAQC